MTLGVAPLQFVVNNVHLTSLDCSLQHTLERREAECESVEVKISTFTSETMIPYQKKRLKSRLQAQDTL